MALTATNLVLGPGTLYTGAFGAAEPADTAVNTTPAATAWTDCGGTDGGVSVAVDQTYTELKVDQVVDSIGRRLTQREVILTTNLAEPTLANLSIALNGSTQVTGAGFSNLEPSNVTSATQPTYIAVLVDGFAPGTTQTWRRRIIARKCLNTSKVDQMYAKDKQVFIPVQFNAHYVSSSIASFHVVDQTA